MEAPPLLITGAPRSGASIVAEAMVANGVFLGDRFGKSDNENSTDHLCDEDISAFHKALLTERGASWQDAASLCGLSAQGPDFAAAAAELLRKFRQYELWGWKDPRAVLFLDEWSRALPSAQWVFVLRRPVEIAWATAARGEFLNSSRWRVAQQALDVWAVYNQRVLDFVESNPERSTVLLLPDDLARGVEALRGRLAEPWDEVLATLNLRASFNSYLLRAEAPRWVRAQAQNHRSVPRLWHNLQRHRAAGRPAAGSTRKRSLSAAGQRRIALVSQVRLAHSETFVQAHIQGLPARVDWLLASSNGEVLTNDEIPLGTLRERVMAGVAEALGTRDEAYATRAIRRYLKRHHIEAVLAEFGTVSVRVMEACRLQGVPLIAHFHGADATRRPRLEKIRASYRRLFDLASALVVVSRDMATQLESLGAPRGKIHYNPCSVDLNSFRGAAPGAAPPTFLATGRYVNKKAPHLTLLAFAQVVAACPEARLILVGDGVLKAVCEDLAKALGIAEAVQFVGFLPHTTIASLMRAVRGFAQHSVEAFDGDSEGTPVAMMEAAAAGLPIIGTYHAGIKELVRHGETGFLVAQGDVDGMASHWISLVRDPALAQRLGAAGREYMRNSPFERTRSLANLWRIIENEIVSARL